MSPGRASAAETAVPYDFWAFALCGSDTPTWAKTYMVSPEQSNAFGPAAAYTYGLPARADDERDHLGGRTGGRHADGEYDRVLDRDTVVVRTTGVITVIATAPEATGVRPQLPP